MLKYYQKVRRNFTLVELLVVIAILAILMSLFMPAMQRVLYRGTATVCVNNLKNITLGQILYCDDNLGRYSNLNDTTNPGHPVSKTPYKGKSTYRGHWDIREMLRPYFGGVCGPEFVCPFNEKEERYGDVKNGLEHKFGGCTMEEGL